MTRRLVACIVLALAALATSSAAATGPSLHLTVFLSSDLPLGQIVWSGTQFLYVGEGRPTAAHIESSDASGHNVANFATAFDQGGEEMRCLPAPVRPAYWQKGIYCHTPDNRIVTFRSAAAPTSSLMSDCANFAKPSRSVVSE